MEYKTFEHKLLNDIITNNKNCINDINKNLSLIKSNLEGENNNETIYNFVNLISDIILTITKKSSLIKKVLKHTSFKTVLKILRNSNLLIRACQIKNKYAIKLLITIGINYSVLDQEGKTALMYAAEDPDLCFVVKYLMVDDDSINITDKNGNNALFYAVSNKKAFKELLNSNIDLNHINNNKESILIYCCKNEKYKLIKALTEKRKYIDLDLSDKNDKTAAMYLTEKGRYLEICYLIKRNCNLNYINQYNESALSLLINNLYNKDHNEDYTNFIYTLLELIDGNCDLNIPVDEDGNTAIMVFILAEDINTLSYALTCGKEINLLAKNKHGQSACSLYFKYPKDCQCKFIIEYPNNDFKCIDNNNNNNIKLVMLSSIAKSKNGENFNLNQIKKIDNNTYPSNININNNYSKFKLSNSLNRTINDIYKTKMKDNDYSDHFSAMFILGLIVSLAVIAL